MARKWVHPTFIRMDREKHGNKVHQDWRVRIGRNIIEGIKEGKTISTMAKEEGVRLERVMLWLEEPTCKIMKKSFGERYRMAVRERSQVWHDRALEQVNALGEKASYEEVRNADARASLLLKVAKVDQIQEKVEAKANGKTVVITKYKERVVEERLTDEEVKEIDKEASSEQA